VKPLSGPTGVIVADDDSIVRGILRARLEAMRQEVFLANDGLEAVELASRMRVALVILDIDMPKLNGNLACERIRKLPGYERTPIVMLTIEDTEDVQLAALRSGATMFLAKPFAPARLMLTLSRYLPMENAALQEVHDNAVRASGGKIFANVGF
jgi:CheY-like chemotaxis protein